MPTATFDWCSSRHFYNQGASQECNKMFERKKQLQNDVDWAFSRRMLSVSMEAWEGTGMLQSLTVYVSWKGNGFGDAHNQWSSPLAIKQSAFMKSALKVGRDYLEKHLSSNPSFTLSKAGVSNTRPVGWMQSPDALYPLHPCANWAAPALCHFCSLLWREREPLTADCGWRVTLEEAHFFQYQFLTPIHHTLLTRLSAKNI